MKKGSKGLNAMYHANCPTVHSLECIAPGSTGLTKKHMSSLRMSKVRFERVELRKRSYKYKASHSTDPFSDVRTVAFFYPSTRCVC